MRAGYSKGTAYSIGWENLRKPEIKAAIDERLAEHALSTGEVLKLVSDCVRASISDCIQIDEHGAHWIDLNKAEEAGVMPAISELSYDKDGRPKIKMYDRLGAMDKILRARGAYVDRKEISGPGGKDFVLEIVNKPHE